MPAYFADPHLQSYLTEFVFRFNRGRSTSRRLVFYRVLELAVGHDPLRLQLFVDDPRTRKVPTVPPPRRGPPPSLDRPRADQPRRTAN